MQGMFQLMLGCSFKKIFFLFLWEEAVVFEWIKQHFWLDFLQCSFPRLEVSLSAVLAESLTASMQKCLAAEHTALRSQDLLKWGQNQRCVVLSMQYLVSMSRNVLKDVYKSVC